MTDGVDITLAGFPLNRGTVKDASRWKARCIDAALVSVALISLGALAMRLLGH